MRTSLKVSLHALGLKLMTRRRRIPETGRYITPEST